ncbi:MAG TPA: hypothetical protein P5330_08490 [Candidatus Competibacteraceae bacterium]|nr:hypothetical protein [Candidatus Competibacteraceae bacterium]
MIGKETRAAGAPISDTPTVWTTRRASHKHRIGLEINAEKLYQLLTCGALSITDFRCLNCASKQQVHRLCLYACAQRLHENDTVKIPSRQRIN